MRYTGVMESPFKIGSWLVEPELNRIVRQKHQQAIEPRLMRLLVLLAAKPRELVAKDVIFDEVWGGLAVTDESLAQAISKLRKLLDDGPDGPVYIETIRKKGYRLVADVTPADPLDAAAPMPGLFRRGAPAMGLAILVVAALWVWNSSKPDTSSTLPSGYFVSNPITSMLGRERDPAISPSGSFVVYSARLPDGSEQIFVHGIGRGTSDRQLTTTATNYAPVFTPDELSVLFLRKQAGNCSVILFTLIDGAERIVGDCIGNSYADTTVSPDGKTIAFSAKLQNEGAHAITLLDLESREQRVVTAPADAMWGDYDPVFSTDGRYLYFARSVSEAMQDVYRLELGTGDLIRISRDGRNIMGIAVTGNSVRFASNRDGRYGIWEKNNKSEGLNRLPISETGIINPSYSASSNRMVFEAITRVSALNRIQDGQVTTLHEFNGEILHPDMANQQNRIVFSSNRSGFYEIWSATKSGQNLTRLTDFRSGFSAHPRFSPNGEFITFDARPTGTARLFVMKSDGSDLRTVGPEDFDNRYAPTWTPDGNGLVYSKETNDQLELWHVSLETGEETQLTTTGGTFGYLLNDNTLLHTRPSEPGIWRKPPDGSEPSRVLETIHFSDWGNWAPAGSSLLYFDRATAKLMRKNLETGDIDDLASVEGYVPTADPAVAFVRGSGEALVVNRVRLESDLQIVDMSPPQQ